MKEFKFWALTGSLWMFPFSLLAAILITLLLYLAAPQLVIFTSDTVPVFRLPSIRINFFTVYITIMLYFFIIIAITLRKIKITLSDNSIISIFKGQKEIHAAHLDTLIKIEASDINSPMRKGHLRFIFENKKIRFLVMTSNLRSSDKTPHLQLIQTLITENSFIKDSGRGFFAATRRTCSYWNPIYYQRINDNKRSGIDL